MVKFCVGSKPWMLARFALSRKEEDPDRFRQAILGDARFFVLDVRGNLFGLVDGASRHQKDRSVKADDIVFVHC